MKIGASKKKWVMAAAVAVMVCVCAAACAQTYRFGDEADEIATIQTALKQLKLYSGEITGHFGEKTETAVKKFQKKYALKDDGVVGEDTLKELYDAAGISYSGSSSSGSSSSGDMLLRYGAQSEAVRTMQQNLTDLGYYTGSITGHFGSMTEAAVMNFQRKNGLSADGIAGAKTLEKIDEALGKASSGSSGGSSSGSTSGSDSLLKYGMEGSEAVRTLQQNLKSLGYYTGNVTGNFGDLTQRAVMDFQRAKGLTADGIAGKRTLAAINADYASGSSSSSGSDSSNVSNLAANVQYTNFYSWRRDYANGEYCTVYDFSTGYSWKLRIMTKDAHMDAEPVTAEDTAIMYKAFGNKETWTPKAVWVTFSDGKTYIGSTHNVPHSPYHLTTNNFKGHLCVHFPIPMEKANEIGPYATSHQEAINEGWAATQKLKY